MFSFGKVKNLIIWWFIFAAELKTYYFRLNIFVYYILLTCGKHLHDRIISLREYVIAHSTSLTTPLFIEVHVSSQKSERSYKCVYRICILLLRFFYCNLELSRQCDICFSITLSRQCDICLFDFHFCTFTIYTNYICMELLDDVLVLNVSI
jgi:hypothetical protein